MSTKSLEEEKYTSLTSELIKNFPKVLITVVLDYCSPEELWYENLMLNYKTCKTLADDKIDYIFEGTIIKIPIYQKRMMDLVVQNDIVRINNIFEMWPMMITNFGEVWSQVDEKFIKQSWLVGQIIDTLLFLYVSSIQDKTLLKIFLNYYIVHFESLDVRQKHNLSKYITYLQDPQDADLLDKFLSIRRYSDTFIGKIKGRSAGVFPGKENEILLDKINELYPGMQYRGMDKKKKVIEQV